jgi:hypothetical protein
MDHSAHYGALATVVERSSSVALSTLLGSHGCAGLLGLVGSLRPTWFTCADWLAPFTWNTHGKARSRHWVLSMVTARSPCNGALMISGSLTINGIALSKIGSTAPT